MCRREDGGSPIRDMTVVADCSAPRLSQSGGAVLSSLLTGGSDGGFVLKVVVMGGRGLIGSTLVAMLREHAHAAAPAFLDTGVNTVTGGGSRMFSRVRRSWWA